VEEYRGIFVIASVALHVQGHFLIWYNGRNPRRTEVAGRNL